MRRLIRKALYRETILYVFIGIITVLVNYIVFSLLVFLWGIDVSLLANFLAFLVAVVVAFVTNKLFVFRSTSWTAPVLKREIPSFLFARVLSFLFEELALWLCLALLHLDAVSFLGITGIHYAKIVLSAIVIILNYVFSKFYIFRQDKASS